MVVKKDESGENENLETFGFFKAPKRLNFGNYSFAKRVSHNKFYFLFVLIAELRGNAGSLREFR